MRIHNMVAISSSSVPGVSPRLFSQEETLDWLDNYKQAIQEAKRDTQADFLEYRCEP